MEIKAKNFVIWFVLLIIGLAMIVGPVVAHTCKEDSQKLPTVKILDSEVPIATKVTNEDKDKKVKDSDNCMKDKKLSKDKKDDDDNSIKIKSHPVLKSPPGSSSMSTMLYRPYRPSLYNMTG